MSSAIGSSGAVAVTGAAGFVGSRLCDQLVSQGIATRALVRRLRASAPALVELEVSLDDAMGLGGALRGAHAVVHLAGRAHVLRETDGDPTAEFMHVNVDGTRRVVEAAAAAGVTTLIFVSSIGAVATTADHDIDDATPPAPDTPYGRSKLAAESVVRDLCDRAGMGYVILRPPMIFGPGMKGNPLRLFRLVDRGIPVPVGAARNRRSTMYVDNLVAAIMAALAMPAGTRDTFVVGDSAPRSSAELTREIASALGRPGRLLPVPRPVMRAAGLVGDLLARVAPVPLTSSAVERLFGSLAVDHTRFGRVAAYRPAVSRADAMARTAAWFRERR